MNTTDTHPQGYVLPMTGDRFTPMHRAPATTVDATYLSTSPEVRAMLATVDGLRCGTCHRRDHYRPTWQGHYWTPNMTRIGQAVVTLAGHADLWAPLIASLPADQTALAWIHTPARGPRLAMLHRPAGHMSGIHSHSTWVAVAPVSGVECHEVWQATHKIRHRAHVAMIESRQLTAGQVATLTVPGDVHSHGHLAGTGDAPYTLVLLGDDMLTYTREEYSPDGTWRYLLPGDPGQRDRTLTARGV